MHWSSWILTRLWHFLFVFSVKMDILIHLKPCAILRITIFQQYYTLSWFFLWMRIVMVPSSQSFQNFIFILTLFHFLKSKTYWNNLISCLFVKTKIVSFSPKVMCLKCLYNPGQISVFIFIYRNKNKWQVYNNHAMHLWNLHLKFLLHTFYRTR